MSKELRRIVSLGACIVLQVLWALQGETTVAAVYGAAVFILIAMGN